MSLTLTYHAGIRVVVSYAPPPIPLRDFDYVATRMDYEPGAPIGYGATEAEAIADLEEREQE